VRRSAAEIRSRNVERHAEISAIVLLLSASFSADGESGIAVAAQQKEGKE
jgi:hypothetical protein